MRTASPTQNSSTRTGRGARSPLSTGLAAVAVGAALVSAGCGGAGRTGGSTLADSSSPSSSASAGSSARPTARSSAAPNLQPATVVGLAAAVATHLDPDRIHGASGGQNEYEKWKAVSFEVATPEGRVPVEVWVGELGEAGDETFAVRCDDDHATLRCRIDTAPDGSPVLVESSTEDLMGAISNHGVIVNVLHPRQGYLVAVSENLTTRDASYVDLTGLPVDVEVLTAIATDPLVGTGTSARLNRVGARQFPWLAKHPG